ncbi:MAG: sulfotransferase [bacterium]
MNRDPLNIIFITGSSYSGTTVLGLILGSSPKIFNGGEVCKYQEIKNQDFKIDPNREVNNICTCGKKYTTCAYWGKIFNDYQKDIDFNPAGFSKENLRLMFKILNPFNQLKSEKKITEEYWKYSELLFREARKLKPHAKYLLDVSKSIYNLYLLKNAYHVNVKVIHMVRNPLDTCNSFKKHRVGFFYSITSWILVNVFVKIFINRAGFESITIKYEKLCTKTDEIFKELNQFLNIKLETNSFVEKVNIENFHVVAGNPFLNDFSFTGLKIKKSKNRLSKLEKLIIILLSTPFKRWIYK